MKVRKAQEWSDLRARALGTVHIRIRMDKKQEASGGGHHKESEKVILRMAGEEPPWCR